MTRVLDLSIGFVVPQGVSGRWLPRPESPKLAPIHAALLSRITECFGREEKAVFVPHYDTGNALNSIGT